MEKTKELKEKPETTTTIDITKQNEIDPNSDEFILSQLQMSQPLKNIFQYRMLVYGPNGVGKSTLVSSLANLNKLKFKSGIILSTEISYSGMSVLKLPNDKQAFATWNEFILAVNNVCKSDHPVYSKLQGPIILDSIRGMWNLARVPALLPFGVKDESLVKWGRGTAAINNLVLPVINKLINFRNGVIFIGHTNTKNIETPGGQEVKADTVDLHETGAKLVKDNCGIMLYMQLDKIRNQEGKLETVRILHSKSDIRFEAKDRSGRLPNRLVVGEHESFQVILDAWNGSQKDNPDSDLSNSKNGNSEDISLS